MRFLIIVIVLSLLSCNKDSILTKWDTYSLKYSNKNSITIRQSKNTWNGIPVYDLSVMFFKNEEVYKLVSDSNTIYYLTKVLDKDTTIVLFNFSDTTAKTNNCSENIHVGNLNNNYIFIEADCHTSNFYRNEVFFTGDIWLVNKQKGIIDYGRFGVSKKKAEVEYFISGKNYNGLNKLIFKKFNEFKNKCCDSQ